MKEKFLWGVAASAYQIEGGAQEDGKGESIWDVFTHTSGKIARGETGDIACDHYHRYKEDVALMGELGVDVYRFSLAWTRILPDGIGRINEKGITFYENLIDELLARGIEPCVTLHHWDFPQKLYEKGFWLNPESPDWFEEYTRVVAERLGKKVKYFITFNEPQCILGGIDYTNHAPALRWTRKDQLQAAHNILKAHGKAVKVLREIVPDAKIGYAPCGWVILPRDNSPLEIERAREAYFKVWEDGPFYEPSVLSDPILLGDYPKEYYDIYKDILPDIQAGDMELISQPIDFYGQNFYTGAYATVDESGKLKIEQSKKVGQAQNFLGWDILPEILYWGPKFLYERYHLPLIITENGMSNCDNVCLDGKVHDAERIDFIQRYINAFKKAKEEGIPIKGYFYWSYCDNFEWDLGYAPRFGLVYINYETQQRIPKDSFFYYKNLIKKEKEDC